MQVYFRRPAQVIIEARGIRWDGDNTGTITPELVSGQVVDVLFNNFTGDNLIVSDGQYPYLEQLIINGSTTLTNIQVPVMTIDKEVQFVACTQSNLTVTGAGLIDVYIDNCSYTNVTMAVNVSGSLHFVSCTPTGTLTLSLTGSLTTFVMDTCGFSALAATLPSGLTTLQVLNCTNMTALPTLPATITTLDASGSALTQASLDAVLAALVSAGLSGGTVNLSGCVWPSSAGLSNKTTLQGRGWTVTVAAFPGWDTDDTHADTPATTFSYDLGLSNPLTVHGDLYFAYTINGVPGEMLLAGSWDGSEVFADGVDIGAGSGDTVVTWGAIKDATGATIAETGHNTVTFP